MEVYIGLYMKDLHFRSLLYALFQHNGVLVKRKFHRTRQIPKYTFELWYVIRCLSFQTFSPT